jgi:hypothetical protein
LEIVVIDNGFVGNSEERFVEWTARIVSARGPFKDIHSG